MTLALERNVSNSSSYTFYFYICSLWIKLELNDRYILKCKVVLNARSYLQPIKFNGQQALFASKIVLRLVWRQSFAAILALGFALFQTVVAMALPSLSTLSSGSPTPSFTVFYIPSSGPSITFDRGCGNDRNYWHITEGLDATSNNYK